MPAPTPSPPLSTHRAQQVQQVHRVCHAHQPLVERSGGRAAARAARAEQRGVAAVEFALILPVFVLLLMGIIELSLMLYDKALLAQASREAARAGIVLRSPKLSAAEITAVALARCGNSLVSFAPSTPTVTVTPSTGGGSFGTPLTVSISYTYTGLALGQLVAAFKGPVVLSDSTTMNNE